MTPDQILRIAINYLVSSFIVVGAGVFIVAKGVGGFRDARIPLTKTKDLTGPMARVAALLFILFGACAILSGIVVGTFCLWRISSLNA